MLALEIERILREFLDPRLTIAVGPDTTTIKTDAADESYGVLIGFTKYAELAAALSIAKHDIQGNLVTTHVLSNDKHGVPGIHEHYDIEMTIAIKPTTIEEWKPT